MKDYVTQMRKLGHSDELIKQELRKVGWPEHHIEKGFTENPSDMTSTTKNPASNLTIKTPLSPLRNPIKALKTNDTPQFASMLSPMLIKLLSGVAIATIIVVVVASIAASTEKRQQEERVNNAAEVFLNNR